MVSITNTTKRCALEVALSHGKPKSSPNPSPYYVADSLMIDLLFTDLERKGLSGLGTQDNVKLMTFDKADVVDDSKRRLLREKLDQNGLVDPSQLIQSSITKELECMFGKLFSQIGPFEVFYSSLTNESMIYSLFHRTFDNRK
jgi:hypothetical protein